MLQNESQSGSTFREPLPIKSWLPNNTQEKKHTRAHTHTHICCTREDGLSSPIQYYRKFWMHASFWKQWFYCSKEIHAHAISHSNSHFRSNVWWINMHSSKCSACLLHGPSLPWLSGQIPAFIHGIDAAVGTAPSALAWRSVDEAAS